MITAMRRVIAFVFIVLPVAVFALDYADISLQYADAPFGRAEGVAISVLTRLGAVQGNPDGTFQPKRAVNRAEFLKIAFLSHPDIEVIAADAANCFPDVRKHDWFSRYVCLAKKRGAVKGYPDGRFHPENPVNYAEALKMLDELYAISAEAPEGSLWYEQYVIAARKAGLLLPISIALDTSLTRGQVARLAASFRAFSEGELEQYRTAESGRRVRPFSSASSASSESSLSASSQSSISSIASIPSLYPARSHQLLIGRLTSILFDGTFTNAGEDAMLRDVRVTLEREVTSIEKLFIVDDAGKDVGELVLDTNDNTSKKKWLRDFDTGAYRLLADTPVTFGIRAQLKPKGGGGGAREVFELFDASSFWIHAEGVTSKVSRKISPSPQHSPLSETVVARLEEVRSTLPPIGELMAGKNRQIAAFAFSGTLLSGSELRLEALSFRVDAPGVLVTNWRIGSAAEFEQQPCGVDSSFPPIVSCQIIPETLRDISDPNRSIGIYADVALQEGVANPQLQVWMSEHGMIGTNRTGDIFWNDSSGTYRWLEEDVPLPQGPRWLVKP